MMERERGGLEGGGRGRRGGEGVGGVIVSAAPWILLVEISPRKAYLGSSEGISRLDDSLTRPCGRIIRGQVEGYL